MDRLISNTRANYLFGIFDKLLELVSIPVLVFALGAEGYGIVVLAQAVLVYLKLFESGVPAGVVKYVAEFEAQGRLESIHRVLNTSLTLHAVLGCLAASLLVLFVHLGGVSLFQVSAAGSQALSDVLLVGAILAVVNWPLQVFRQGLWGLQEYGTSNVYAGIGSAVAKGGSIVAALLGFPVGVVFLILNLNVTVEAAFEVRWLTRRFPAWKPGFLDADRAMLGLIFGYSTWLLLSQISKVLVYETDRIIIAVFLPVSALTAYQVITRPLEIIQQLANTFGSALTPAVSASEARDGIQSVSGIVYTGTKYLNALLAVLAVGGTYLCGPFIVLWMGEPYRSLAWIVQLACAFKLVQHSNAVVGKVFMGTGRVRTISLIALGVALFNVPLGIWWVNLFGVAGVVLSTLAAFSIGIGLQYAIALPVLGIARLRYVKSVLQGQWPALTVGLLLWPAWPHFQGISSWGALIAHGIGLGACLLAVQGFLVVDSEHRRKLKQTLLVTRSGHAN